MLLTTDRVLRSLQERAAAYVKELPQDHPHRELVRGWPAEIEATASAVESHAYDEKLQAQALGLARLVEQMLDYLGAPSQQQLRRDAMGFRVLGTLKCGDA